MLSGVNVCLRRIESATIYEAIKTHKVTHLCGAPIIMGLIINAPDEMVSLSFF
jgi:fatty-acyl-CoA synthase